jgi:undecaprenyl-diphosphatase
MDFLSVIILAVIEGLTEFLPISSTGHMILASSLMKMENTEFLKTFEIVIQLGAILAVLILYLKRFFVSFNIYLKLLVAFLPTGVIGFIAYKTIKEYLFNPVSVSTALILGGVILIVLDKWTEKKKSKYEKAEDISYSDAVKIGFFQCLSMIPGVSRAAATIFGGIFSGFDRKLATEFSFLLAIPTMFAASGLDLLETRENIHSDDLFLLLAGAGIAFFFAMLAVKVFIAIVQVFGFKYFGYYRIILGVVFLLLSYKMGLTLVP